MQHSPFGMYGRSAEVRATATRQINPFCVLQLIDVERPKAALNGGSRTSAEARAGHGS
jgi:hypothetical protein